MASKRPHYATNRGREEGRVEGTLYLKDSHGRKVARVKVKQRVSLDEAKLRQMQRQGGSEVDVKVLD